MIPPKTSSPWPETPAGAKLVYGLAQLVPPENLTIIASTAADFEHLGLHISPGPDAIMYTLAGIANPVTGKGMTDESWNMMAALARYGGPTWLQLGDRDLSTHLLRTQWLREGHTLTWITAELSQRLGIRCTVLPMSENLVRVMIQTEEGELAFQEYRAQKRRQPGVKSLRYAGIEAAQPSREVVSAIRTADVIIFGPGNPAVSLDPILALPNLRRILAASRAPKIGVSPIVGGDALTGPTAKMMAELGLDVSAAGVAGHFGDVLTGFVLDSVDQAQQQPVNAMGLRTLVTGIVMMNNEDRVQLARDVLDFAENM